MKGGLDVMASETKEQPKSAMATDAAAGGADDERDARDERDREEGARPEPKVKPDYATPASARQGPGFFTIYKKGQGYWTRMGTAISVTALAALTAYELYDKRVRAFVIDYNEGPGLATYTMRVHFKEDDRLTLEVSGFGSFEASKE